MLHRNTGICTNRDKISLPVVGQHPDNAPEFGNHAVGKNWKATPTFPQTVKISIDKVRELRHGYYACVSYVDALVGRLLDELAKLELVENTVVVLWGDHGFHLGEQGLWTKANNYELATRAPLIISVPGQHRPGAKSDALVEFVDVLSDLGRYLWSRVAHKEWKVSGLKAIAEESGASLEACPCLASIHAPATAVAIEGHGAVMGYALRTHHYRYVEWRDWKSKEVVARELYDHRSDPNESYNLAAESKHATTVQELAEMLERGWRSALPALVEKTE